MSMSAERWCRAKDAIGGWWIVDGTTNRMIGFSRFPDDAQSIVDALNGTNALRADLDRAQAALDTPEIRDFMKGVPLEAMHQRKRWGTDHDSGKTPADWFWLVGYLAGKALHAHAEGRTEKALHHVVTTAAALANWHSAMLDKTDMRPGIETPTEEQNA